MKSILPITLSVITLGLVLGTNNADALTPPSSIPSFETVWKFAVRYPGAQGHVVEDQNVTLSGPIPMPENSPWACSRVPVQIDSEHVLVGGWNCKSGDSELYIRAMCYPDQEDLSNGQVGISSKGEQGLTLLSVWCTTRARQSAPPVRQL